MAQHPAQGIVPGRFHFEIAKAKLAFGALVAEVLQAGHIVRLAQVEAQDAALGPVEAGAREGVAHHHARAHLLAQQVRAAHHVGRVGQAQGLLKRRGNFSFQAGFHQWVKLHETVEAHGVLGGQHGPNGHIGLQAAAGAQPDDAQVQAFFRRAHGARNKVDVDQGVQLVHHDVDVVGAHAGAEHGEALAAVVPHVRHELAVRGFELHRIKMPAYLGHPGGVAHGEDGVGNVVGQQVQVINAAVGIQDELGGRNHFVNNFEF